MMVGRTAPQKDTASSVNSLHSGMPGILAQPRALVMSRPIGYDSRPFRPYAVSAQPSPRGTLRMTTVSAKPAEVRREWYVVDADGKTLGRLATEIARRLRGKHKPEYTPHVDTGDYVVVVNAEKIRVTGNKLQDKMYHWHTGYIGNLKSISLEKQLQRAPERVIQTAVRGMMPRLIISETVSAAVSI